MSFKKILGQEKAVAALKGFISSRRVPRAMIFYGPGGVGKASAALEFAKTLNCLERACGEEQDNCGVCQNCRHIDSKTHPDVIFADFQYQAALEDGDVEKQQTVKIDTVRGLSAASQQKHVMAGWKVYIIDNAQKLTAGAANALLKFIEEPPPRTVWILVSSKKEAMLPTVRSRSQAVLFSPLSAETVENILKDNHVQSSIARRAAFYAQGSTEKAFLAAEILNELSSFDGGADYAAKAALSLPKTLAQARLQAACMLDMLCVRAHGLWTNTYEEEKKTALKDLLSKMVFYKNALNRNTSPYLIAEAAFISAEACAVDLKEPLE